ncbi:MULTISPECIES: sensor histidine kinase [Lysobacter]|jgi:signal transduction histidine kinase|uniref:Histidine kinase-, DNA gyrase B-, and HSP90-like ATPase family protein n=1 Tax=Lysobacter antibioticus TaxID=84531 RepID=A0A0S2FDW6_LYSAN|nr:MULTISPECIES: sensor histidine kinase [Lysobacter]ALN81735.1 histidine kinase-, DNA gyrase B-, and HSP90-like ATPase family protein [Lysobacter antibioticus]
MLARLTHTRLLRYAGLFTWGLVGSWLLSIWLDPDYFQPGHGEPVAGLYLQILRWVAVYATFGAVYWWITRSLGERRTGLLDYLQLLVLGGCAIGISYYSGTGLGSVLLMVLAGLLPWMVPLRVGVIGLMVLNLVIIPVFIEAVQMPPLLAVLQSLLYTGFSGFVFLTALVAKQQTQAREDQRRLNAELRATRALLAESARINERTRISRELHDLLGHHLTALSLNLEVAGHLSEGRVKEHVQQAHTLARLLLTDVREAVSQLRENGAIDLALALRPLAENVPALDIRMEIETPLTLDDPERAHVLLRCTQEIVTNTVRHAGAQHLWIDVRRSGDDIVMSARDDGRGADHLVTGNGLRGMRERLQQYGGRLSIETRADAGFCLQLTLPATAAAMAREGALT